jgi:thiamine biosynthesis lipoprotein
MPTVTLARDAMATRFELVLHGDNPTALRAAGEEALDEIERLESQLSLYRPGSEIAQVNARAAREPVCVSPAVFALLEHARRLHAETGGAFDITIGPLVRCWGFMGGTGKLPPPEEIAAARASVGMSHVQLDPRNRTVRFARAGVMLDLGALGKGYAVGQAADLLREAGVTSALIHGGTSTVYGLGRPPDGGCWTVALETPPAALGVRRFPDLPTVTLCDEAMSVSAVWGRSFQTGGATFGHVIHPRTGQPVRGGLLAAVALPCATETDALSTALLAAGAAEHQAISRLRPGMRTLLVTEAADGLRAETSGVFPSRQNVR